MHADPSTSKNQLLKISRENLPLTHYSSHFKGALFLSSVLRRTTSELLLTYLETKSES